MTQWTRVKRARQPTIDRARPPYNENEDYLSAGETGDASFPHDVREEFETSEGLENSGSGQELQADIDPVNEHGTHGRPGTYDWIPPVSVRDTQEGEWPVSEADRPGADYGHASDLEPVEALGGAGGGSAEEYAGTGQPGRVGEVEKDAFGNNLLDLTTEGVDPSNGPQNPAHKMDTQLGNEPYMDENVVEDAHVRLGLRGRRVGTHLRIVRKRDVN